MSSHIRASIYYWKCDRPAAFHTTTPTPGLQEMLHTALCEKFGPCELHPGGGQGNHLTFRTTLGGKEAFLRVEDGPEQDDYIEVESHVLDIVRGTGVRTPLVPAFDAFRKNIPFAWQALEYIPDPDLNQWLKKGQLDAPRVARQIGTLVARWQSITPAGFGPFNIDQLREKKELLGFHPTYETYFRLRLEEHLAFLQEHAFLSAEQTETIRKTIDAHRGLLQLPQGCLVHKDLALWNILGTLTDVTAVIDWDDSISGDPMDDLSLLGCFHDGAFLGEALEGYRSIRPLPANWRERFWLHLLRNMLVKSVIRVGAGYFERGNSFFLIGSSQSGEDLRNTTLHKLHAALRGLNENQDLDIL